MGIFRSNRRYHIENALEATELAIKSLERLVEWMKIDASLVRRALKNGGDPDISVPDDDLRMVLAEQLASLLIAQENLMRILGRKFWFDSVRPVYPPFDPKESEELIAKVWAKLWPEKPFPLSENLTDSEIELLRQDKKVTSAYLRNAFAKFRDS